MMMKMVEKFSVFVLITCTLLIVPNESGPTHRPLESDKPTKTDETTQSDQKSEATEFFEKLFAESNKRSTNFNSQIAYYRTQKIDHIFNRMHDDRQWKQRVMRGNLQEPPTNSPIFLSFEGFDRLDWDKMETGPWVQLAKNFTTISYELENRYYGESLPVKDLSNENLQYLNSEQQLADIIRFIDASKFKNRKWIAFGKGYGGTLAARLRLKYSHRIMGAVVYNAPLLVQTENKKYYELFKNGFTENVKNNIREAYKQMRATITQNNYDNYKKKFNMCDVQDSKGNQDTNTDFMFWSLTTYLVEVVKLKRTNDAAYKDIIGPLDHESVENLIDTFVSAVEKILKFFGEKCLNIDFETAFNAYKVPEPYDGYKTYPKQLNLGLGLRQAHWQQCIEFGMFNTSDGENTFGEKIALELYAKMCEASFDIEFNSTIFDEMFKKTNMVYGGQNIGASQIIYISRGDKPNVGITESKSDDRIAIHIEDGKQPDQLQHEYDLIISKLKEWHEKEPEIKVESQVSKTHMAK